MGEVTLLLQASSEGDQAARNEVFRLVYAELKALANRVARSAGPQYTLDTTGLVHECFVRLAGADARDRGHFYSLAARAMRQVLCDHARRRTAGKRNEGRAIEELDDDLPSGGEELGRLIELDDLLEKLAFENERAARVIECRVFGGLTVEETAEALAISVRTVHLDVERARAWLAPHLS